MAKKEKKLEQLEGLEQLGGLEAALGHEFGDAGLLRAALLHRSAEVERGMGAWAESQRLEFLGDAVLDLLAADWLMKNLPPGTREGRLTRLRSRLTCTEAFADVARRLGLGGLVVLGVGEERNGGRERASLLADTLEAVFGAVWLDGGWAAAEAAFGRVFAGELDAAAEDGAEDGNPKGVLQELAQARGAGVPVYETTAVEGPPHARRFTVEVCADGLKAEGAGSSKRQAEQAAAGEWLKRFFAGGAAVNPADGGSVENNSGAGHSVPPETEQT